MASNKNKPNKLTKREVEYFVSLIDKDMARFEEVVEEVDEIGDEAGNMKEARSMLKMLGRIRLAVIDLDKA